MFATSLFTLSVVAPVFSRNPKLIGDQFQYRWTRCLIDAKKDAWKAQVAELDSKAKDAKKAAETGLFFLSNEQKC